MRVQLRFLILDGFDPDTGVLTLRLALQPGEEPAVQMIRLRLHLGRPGSQPLEPLRRELRTQAQMPLPTLWENDLKVVLHALEAEMQGPDGRNPVRYLWVQTQILHPADPARSTPCHPVDRQVDILRDWARRLDQEGHPSQAAQVLERLLLLAPRDVAALVWLTSFFRSQGMAVEMASVAERWVRTEPERLEARLRLGEALLRLGRLAEARATFEEVLKAQPFHLLGHLGMAQALAQLGGNPFPHLDAAQELDPAATVAVLRETFDYRLAAPPSGDREHALDDLPALLGVSGAEVEGFLRELGLPRSGPEGQVRESELALWVGVVNRYALLRTCLRWSAPTPRQLPELP